MINPTAVAVGFVFENTILFSICVDKKMFP